MVVILSESVSVGWQNFAKVQRSRWLHHRCKIWLRQVLYYVSRRRNTNKRNGNMLEASKALWTRRLVWRCRMATKLTVRRLVALCCISKPLPFPSLTQNRCLECTVFKREKFFREKTEHFCQSCEMLLTFYAGLVQGWAQLYANSIYALSFMLKSVLVF